MLVNEMIWSMWRKSTFHVELISNFSQDLTIFLRIEFANVEPMEWWCIYCFLFITWTGWKPQSWDDFPSLISQTFLSNWMRNAADWHCSVNVFIGFDSIALARWNGKKVKVVGVCFFYFWSCIRKMSTQAKWDSGTGVVVEYGTHQSNRHAATIHEK